VRLQPHWPRNRSMPAPGSVNVTITVVWIARREAGRTATTALGGVRLQLMDVKTGSPIMAQQPDPGSCDVSGGPVQDGR
jgi:hypothetical protein